jgi:hypothetical protein
VESLAPDKPIVSTRAEDPEYDDLIDRFVVALGERVDAFQDAVSAGDRLALRALAEALAREAGELGYPALVAAAERVRGACGEPGAEAARKAVVDLTELSQRVRRGHRSAAL